MTMTLIETIEVGAGGAASIEFTSIPQDGVDLLILLSGRTDRAQLLDSVDLAINSSTIDFSWASFRGSGSTVTSASSTSNQFTAATLGDTGTSLTFSSNSFYFSNYSSSSAKSISSDSVGENNATAAHQTIQATLWDDTSAITSIELSPAGGTIWKQYTSASLYKIS